MRYIETGSRRYIDVFSLRKGDKVIHNETGQVGVITDVRETQNETVEAFVSWPESQDETKLNCYDTNIYLLPRES